MKSKPKFNTFILNGVSFKAIQLIVQHLLMNSNENFN
jgi:hypothetical protein